MIEVSYLGVSAKCDTVEEAASLLAKLGFVEHGEAGAPFPVWPGLPTPWWEWRHPWTHDSTASDRVVIGDFTTCSTGN